MTKQIVTLDSRISDALGDATKTSSDDLRALLLEIEQGIKLNDEWATNSQARCYDLTVSGGDAETALQKARAFELTRDRFKIAQSRLEEKLKSVVANEYKERWLADRDRVKVTRDNAADQFERLRDIFKEIILIFKNADAVDQEVARVNSIAPDGEPRLTRTELYARNLGGFNYTTPALAEVTKLFDFDTGEEIWPRKTLNAWATQLYGAPAHRLGNWWQDSDAIAAERVAEGKRQADFYDKQAAEAEERKNKENREAYERYEQQRRAQG
jgi:hypothetical protein